MQRRHLALYGQMRLEQHKSTWVFQALTHGGKGRGNLATAESTSTVAEDYMSSESYGYCHPPFFSYQS